MLFKKVRLQEHQFLLALLLMVIPFSLRAVPLENWRLPFFKVASDFELSNGSPGRMFWDNIESAQIFDSALWIPKTLRDANYWMVEPAVTGGLKSPYPAAASTPFFFHGDLFNDIRFHRLTIGQSLDIDSRYQYDASYPAHQDRALYGRIEEAYCQLDWSHGFFSIGRKKRSWGPFPDRSLILSPNPYTYDAIEWQVFGSFFEFRHLFAPFPLKKVSWDSDNQSVRDRYFTAHSLNLIFGKWVTVGITEAVVFTRKRGFPDLQYVNPVSIYTVTNTNQEGDGNLMLGFQWNIHPGIETVSFRGQLVLDDFQVDNEVVTDQEPTHWGLDAGIFWRDPLPIISFSHLLKIEYTFASEWLYTVPDNNGNGGERYIYGRKSLGLSYNDGSQLRLGTMFVPKRYGAYGISLSYTKSGGNNEMSRWNDSEHILGLPFDTNAPQQHRFAVGAEGFFYIKDYAHLYAYGDLGWLRNKNNVKTDGYVFDPGITIEASIHFSDFVKRLP